jgi:hypothetical protein
LYIQRTSKCRTSLIFKWPISASTGHWNTGPFGNRTKNRTNLPGFARLNHFINIRKYFLYRVV